MTNEDKELLLKDLCTRLPYGVKIRTWYEKSIVAEVFDVNKYTFAISISTTDDEAKIYIDNVKSYLRPMSSMTEEEKDEYDRLVMCNASWVVDDWLNKKMFDYRGLIKKGLALEAPEGLYSIS